jgi:hypothetical protein
MQASSYSSFQQILPEFLAMVKDKNDPQNLISNLRKREFSISEAGVSSRVFNFWMQKEIINIPKDFSSKWTKLNFIDYVWLCMVRDLREIGLPIEVIKKIKEQVFIEMTVQFDQLLSEEKLREEYIKFLMTREGRSNEKSEFKMLLEKLNNEVGEKKFIDEIKNSLGTSFNQLEYSLYAKQIFNLNATLIVIFKNKRQRKSSEELLNKEEDPELNNDVGHAEYGTSLIWSDIYSALNPEIAIDSLLRNVFHISLPVDSYIEDFVTKEKNEMQSKRLGWLSNDEYQLIHLIRTKAPDQIEIKLKNNNIELIEVIKYHKPSLESKLLKHFGANDYGEITWVYSNGKKQSIRISEKFKILEKTEK